jgi:hypothetical protein
MHVDLETLKRLTEAEGRDFSVLTISYKAIPASRRRTAPTGLVRPTGKRIAGDIRTFAAIGVHDLIFDFRGPSTAESIEPAKVRHGSRPARGGLTTVRAAVMVWSGAQPRFAGADLVRLSGPSTRQA